MRIKIINKKTVVPDITKTDYIPDNEREEFKQLIKKIKWNMLSTNPSQRMHAYEIYKNINYFFEL